MSTTDPTPRARILAAALQVFSADGFDAGSINDVAIAAGMSRHNLLYYFPTKREVLLAVLDARDENLDARLRWMESATDLSLAEFTESLTDVLGDIYADRQLMQLYHRLGAEAADPQHPAYPWISARYRRLREATRRVLEASAARGELAPDLDPVGLSAALLGAVEGLESQWLVDPSLDWNRASIALRTMLQGVSVTSRMPPALGETA